MCLDSYEWDERTGAAHLRYAGRVEASNRATVVVAQPAPWHAGWDRRPRLSDAERAAMFERHVEALAAERALAAAGAYAWDRR
jgi:hypothetical protein